MDKHNEYKCVFCNNKIVLFVSFGNQPIANGFLTADGFSKEYFFELSVGFCPECFLVQLLEQPTPEMMFNESYAFFSGTSNSMIQHFQNFSDDIATAYLTHKPNSFVVEIGSNDGIMLQNFKTQGFKHLGIEPSLNVANVARGRGINVLNKFFNSSTAKEVKLEHGKADAILAANVLCHISDIRSVFEGFRELLHDGGVIAFEDPYLGDVIQKNSYDQIYDEHMFLFSVNSVSKLAESFGFEVIGAEHQMTHGGSMRYYLGIKGQHKVSDNVLRIMKAEKELGITEVGGFLKFSQNCENSKRQLLDLLIKLKNEGKKVVGYAATSKSTTVLNYCNIGPDLISYICDTTPIKQGKFSPGVHIPIVPYEQFSKDRPDFAVLFAWNHKDEIFKKEQQFMDRGGKWIFFVPEVHVG
ncbi:MAG: class I SAM-dependent methyltransferase [Bdellovibrionales bacterium]|nr:class I SAM-dependent methyltransferase [Bdellovibrionales bacterium]